MIVTTDDKHYGDIADAIRDKLGTTDGYKPEDMAAAVGDIESGGGNYQSKSVTYTSNGIDKVTPDAGYDALSEVNVTVDVSGGGGASVETCTVVLDGASSNYRPYYYSYTTIDANGNITGAAVSNNSATDVTLNNVVCESVVTVYWYSIGSTLNAPTNATLLLTSGKYFNVFLITATAGGTATIVNDPQSSGGML